MRSPCAASSTAPPFSPRACYQCYPERQRLLKEIPEATSQRFSIRELEDALGRAAQHGKTPFRW